MKHYVETQWMGKMQFNALVNGHTLVMDGPERVGGENNGPIPKPFVLTALTGCTGMDIVALLRKAGKQVSDFKLRVEGEISHQSPIEYTGIHLVYELCGDINFQQDVLDAITNSQEKICGVSNMLKKILPLTWEILYNGKQIFNNKETGMSGRQAVSEESRLQYS
jgi:putative redox protein